MQNINNIDKGNNENVLEYMPTIKEKLSYGCGDMAGNIVFGMASALITMFYTDYVGCSAAMVALVMLISRFFDGLSDVVMGFIVSRTKTKWGKARPWILWGIVPYCICAVALFTVPVASETVQFWYILLTYNLSTTVMYTWMDIPYGTLSTMMTRSSKGRSILAVYRMTMSPIGRVLSVSLTMPVVKIFGDDQAAWAKAMLIWVLIGAFLYVCCFRNCKERVYIPSVHEKKYTIGQNLKALLINPYFWAILILWCVQCGYITVFGTVAPYYCKYVLGNDSWLYSVMYAVDIAILVGGCAVAGLLLRKIGKRNLAMGGAILVIVAQLLLLINPYSAVWALITTVIRACGAVPINAVIFGMLGDVVEYGQWKTHVRQESLIYAASSVGIKVGMGLIGGITGILLSIGGYVSSTTGSAVQPQSALDMITNMFIWGPMLLFAISFVILLLYKLDKFYPIIMKELQEREGRGEA